MLVFPISRAVAPAVFHSGPARSPLSRWRAALAHIRETPKPTEKRKYSDGGILCASPTCSSVFPLLFFVLVFYSLLVYPCRRTGIVSSCVSTWTSTPCLHSEPAPCCCHSRPTPCRSCVDIISSHAAVLSPQSADSNYCSGRYLFIFPRVSGQKLETGLCLHIKQPPVGRESTFCLVF